MWVNEGIFARTTVSMTWPEIMFYLTARSEDNRKKPVDDRSQSLGEMMVARARETGRRGGSIADFL